MRNQKKQNPTTRANKWKLLRKSKSLSISLNPSSERILLKKRFRFLLCVCPFRCKDYYEILSVTKESTDTEIKKAYKKLALQLHPDKNKAPGAAEAFKAVGNAVATLTDAEKRKAYDLYGADEANNGMRRQSHRHHSSGGFAYSQGFESDVTAEV